MRTATPFVTCSSITDWRLPATAGEISTPSFMGPGCMTSAPGRAQASRSSVTWERGAGSPAGAGPGRGQRRRAAEHDLGADGSQRPEVRAGDAAVGDIADDNDAAAAEIA